MCYYKTGGTFLRSWLAASSSFNFSLYSCRWADGRIDGWQMNDWTNEWMNEWMGDGWVIGWVMINEWMNEWMEEWLDE